MRCEVAARKQQLRGDEAIRATSCHGSGNSLRARGHSYFIAKELLAVAKLVVTVKRGYAKTQREERGERNSSKTRKDSRTIREAGSSSVTLVARNARSNLDVFEIPDRPRLKPPSSFRGEILASDEFKFAKTEKKKKQNEEANFSAFLRANISAIE